ncbi:MAG: DUF5667 domain-containing protein [Dehalococcoidales bacterium]|nr:DUF5667 domain-containing protein [Dehalococcoidales bacterium]
MGNNKQFNAILDECLERLLTGKETVEQCLQLYPEHARELEPLLRTAKLMNKAVDVKPSADFRARARYQLRVKMTESRTPKRAPVFAPRWAVAVCAVLLVFVLGGGTVLAADGSMPGSPLYPVKLAAENVRVKLTGSEEKKLELYAAIADRRVAEMAQMVDSGKTQHMEASAQRLNIYYSKMSELPLAKNSETMILTSHSAASNAPVTAPQVTTTTVAAPTALTAPINPIVKDTQSETLTKAPTSEKAYGTTDRNNIETTEATVASNDAETGANGRAKLRNILGHYAITQPEKLRELLDSDKVPEAAKPALRRALWASEYGYKQTIDNLK